MPINLDRAEQIGEENKTPAFKSDLLLSQIEVLTINKIPFNGVSFLRDGFYQCPFCRRSAIKQILDYRCHKCESKVIAWQCYTTKKEEKHQLYDSYISRFYESCDAKTTMLKAKYKKEGKEWPGDPDPKTKNSYPN
tara:strand:+ start:163 stop:570 length:408 start_codon:yes stop_codon:yes gene_type:complete